MTEKVLVFETQELMDGFVENVTCSNYEGLISNDAKEELLQEFNNANLNKFKAMSKDTFKKMEFKTVVNPSIVMSLKEAKEFIKQNNIN